MTVNDRKSEDGWKSVFITRKGMEKMRTINLKRGVALLLALCMTLSLLPVTVLAADTDQPQSQLDAAPTEDASAQLGAYTPLAEPSEQEDEPPAEEPAREPASSGEASP